MSADGDGTAEDTEIIREQGSSASTKAKRARLESEFTALLERRGLPLGQDALEAWVTKRVIDGVKASTFKSELASLKVLYPSIEVDPRRENEFLAGAVDLAPSESSAKMNLSLKELTLLLDATEGQAFKKSHLSAADQARMRLRDRTFFAMAFAGIPRGAELAKLEWEQIRGLWRLDTELVERAFGHEERNGNLEGVKVYLFDTKTDKARAGQAFTVRRRPSLPENWSPAVLLQRLYDSRGVNTGPYVFAKYDGSDGHVKSSSFRSKFKRLLKEVIPADRLKQLSLHSFRKGGTTQAVKAGVRPEIVNRQGRWKDPTTCLEFYAIIGDDDSLEFSDQVLANLERHLAGRNR